MKALYLFMNSELHKQSGLFKDAVACGDFKLAPIDSYKKQAAIDYCYSNNIQVKESDSTECIKVIEGIEDIVVITNYEDAKVVCNHFKEDIIDG